MTKIMTKSDEKVIYLAGGFKSGWQLTVHNALPDFELLDPSMHNIEQPEAYTDWDLNAIGRCSVVLAYMESTNPAGYALALEIGYAKALGKTVLFVDGIEDASIKRYFEMVRQVSDRVFPTLQQAIKYIKQN